MITQRTATLLVAGAALSLTASRLAAQTNLGTSFTYQGQINQGTTAISGTVDIQFRLFDVATGGAALGTSTVLAVPVSSGLFSATPDFGSLFDGRAMWIEIATRFPAGSGTYTTLAPRQTLTAAPYALGLRLPLAETVSVTSGNGLRIQNTGANGSGLFGLGSGTGGRGVLGSSTGIGGVGVYGTCGAGATSGVEGLHADVGTLGRLGATQAGVLGVSSTGATDGVKGINNNANNGAGVRAEHTVSGNYAEMGHPSRGVIGAAAGGSSVGVEGVHAASGNYGWLGVNGYGVYGISPSTGGTALWGYASATTGEGQGVYGESAAAAGFGVRGNTTAFGGYGVLAQNTPERTTAHLGGVAAVAARKRDASNIVGTYATLADSGSAGLFHGILNNAAGIVVTSNNGIGAAVTSTSSTASALDVTNVSGGRAAWFEGPVLIRGETTVAMANFQVVNGLKLFLIDHPLDPSNKDLAHSCIESPEMKNLYDGTVTTDQDGRAVVELPAYFEALNEHFRYQLTVVGSFARAMVESEIRDNRFAIRTDLPRTKVCWQITGNRHDPYARAHPLVVEKDKPESLRGKPRFQPGAADAPASQQSNH